MSEKRFELSESEITDYRIYDYKQEDAYFISCPKHTAECLVNLLNSLNYDNEELTISIKLFEDDVKILQGENEQLKSTIIHLEEECGARENDYENLKKQFHKIPKNIREVWKE